MLDFIKHHLTLLKKQLNGFPMNLIKKVPINSNSRIYLIDEIRGFAIIGMIVYHFFYDLVYFFNVNIPFFFSPIVRYTIPWFSATFIFLAGISCNLSKNNLKRGIRCLVTGLCMTIITMIALPDDPYIFGVLHLLGISMILYHYSKPLLQKIPTKLGIIISFIIMHITYNISRGFLEFFWLSFRLPQSFYQSDWLFFLGFPNSSFNSSDYFPLNPWSWCFVAGAYLGIFVKERKLPDFFYKPKPYSNLLATLGVNSLFIYVIHQPIMYLTLLAIYH